MNSDQVHINKLTLSDLEELRNLSIETFYESFGSVNTEENMQHYIGHFLSAARLTAEISNPGSEFYFARLNGIAAGYLKINVGNAQTDLQEDKGFEIERIYVKSSFQGNRIGQLLFDKAIQLAHEQATDYLWLGVWEKNSGAIRFYERNGLVKFATHPFQLGDDQQTDILMKINLR